MFVLVSPASSPKGLLQIRATNLRRLEIVVAEPTPSVVSFFHISTWLWIDLRPVSETLPAKLVAALRTCLSN